MSRAYEVQCGRTPELSLLARLATPVLRQLTETAGEVVVEADELRSCSAVALVRVAGSRLEAIARRPEDELLALVTALVAHLEFDGYFVHDLTRAERPILD